MDSSKPVSRPNDSMPGTLPKKVSRTVSRTMVPPRASALTWRHGVTDHQTPSDRNDETMTDTNEPIPSSNQTDEPNQADEPEIIGYAVHWVSDDHQQDIPLAEDADLDVAERLAEAEVEKRALVGGFLDTYQLVAGDGEEATASGDAAS